MKILDIKQGTDEWLELRNKYHTASEASIMMGQSKQVSRNDLLYLKFTGEQQKFSDWMENVLFSRGHEIEDKARAIAEEIISEQLYPSVGISDDNRFLASFDGLTMNHDIVWECKQWNESKAQLVKKNEIPPENLWQVVHQLFVSEAQRCLYMVTDGTIEKTAYCWYESDSVMHFHLLMGWNQFDSDLKKYTLPKETPQIIGTSPDTLPSLRIEVSGMVKSSNLDEFKNKAFATLEQINTELQTDTDFANAEKTVKWCRDIEEKLDYAKEQALSQTATIDELFKTIDSIKESTRNKRLQLDRLVKERKRTIRTEIAEKAEKEIYQHLELLNKTLQYVYIPFDCPDFHAPMKGKKTIKSLHDSVDDLVAQTKIQITKLADEIRVNLKSYEAIGKAHHFLFNDLQQIITKPNEDFEALLKIRITEYKTDGHAHVEKIRKELANKQADAIKNYNRPSDKKIVDVLCEYFSVTENTVKSWLSEMNLQKDTDNVKRRTY